MEVDLLICRGDESGCVAAVQAARMGVKRIAIVNDIAASLESIHEIQLRLIRGAGGPGMLIWPRHDVSPEDAIVVKLK